jgi:hypothetical protein
MPRRDEAGLGRRGRGNISDDISTLRLVLRDLEARAVDLADDEGRIPPEYVPAIQQVTEMIVRLEGNS